MPRFRTFIRECLGRACSEDDALAIVKKMARKCFRGKTASGTAAELVAELVKIADSGARSWCPKCRKEHPWLVLQKSSGAATVIFPCPRERRRPVVFDVISAKNKIDV